MITSHENYSAVYQPIYVTACIEEGMKTIDSIQAWNYYNTTMDDNRPYSNLWFPDRLPVPQFFQVQSINIVSHSDTVQIRNPKPVIEWLAKASFQFIIGCFQFFICPAIDLYQRRYYSFDNSLAKPIEISPNQNFFWQINSNDPAMDDFALRVYLNGLLFRSYG